MPICPQCKQAYPQSAGSCPNCIKSPGSAPPQSVTAENDLVADHQADPDFIPLPDKDEKIFAIFGAPLHTIGGWLLLPFLALGKYAFDSIKYLININEEYLIPRAEYVEAGRTGLVLFSDFNIIMEVGLLGFCFYIFFLFAKRRRATPKMYILFMLSQLMVGIVNIIWLSRLSPVGVSIYDIALETGLITSASITVIWCLYFRFSKRVKHVFVD